MALLNLDHLAVSATSLAQGASHVETIFGTKMALGGEHPEMGTHNRLLGLGPDLYFEVIAINPNSPAPYRPRWFNIDNFEGPPRLTNWVIKTANLDAALAMLPEGFGKPVALQRGDLNWHMAVPLSGILPWGGWGPALIEWQGNDHPAKRLGECGIRLRTLTLHHRDAREIAETLGPLMPRDTALFVPAETPKLVACFDTPSGEIVMT